MLFVQFMRQSSIPLFCLLFFVKTIYASEPLYIGYVTGLENEVITRTVEGERKLQLNEKIFFKQQILTKDNGKVELTFRDGSTFEIAPKSVVILDEFIFNPKESVSEKSINVLKGAFRYISGLAIKNSATEIKTSFGTAGIRGSLVVANANGSLDIFVGNGLVTLTTVDGKSEATLTTGLGGSTTGDKAVQTSDEKTAQLATYFTQASFWVDLASNHSTPEERATQAAADAKANNKSESEQIQAYNAALAAPPPSKTEITPLPPIYSRITTDPQKIITTYSSTLNALYTEKSTEATLLVVKAAITNNSADAVAITKAAVAANPKLVDAIEHTAVAAAPNLKADIIKAATEGLSDSKKETPEKHNTKDKEGMQHINNKSTANTATSDSVAQSTSETTANPTQQAIQNVLAAIQQGSTQTMTMIQALINTPSITPSDVRLVINTATKQGVITTDQAQLLNKQAADTIGTGGSPISTSPSY